MQIGITIANHRDLLSPPYIQTTARMAEDLGFDSVWIPDHIVAPRAVEERYGPVYYDAMAVLAYLAGITRRVRLGTTVLVVPSRHPVVLAKQVASIDQLSHGRVILGIGVGLARAEFDLLKVAFSERGPRTDEALQLMQALWTQDAPRFEGTYSSGLTSSSSLNLSSSRSPSGWAAAAARRCAGPRRSPPAGTPSIDLPPRCSAICTRRSPCAIPAGARHLPSARALRCGCRSLPRITAGGSWKGTPNNSWQTCGRSRPWAPRMWS
jgi:hypothetical protein